MACKLFIQGGCKHPGRGFNQISQRDACRNLFMGRKILLIDDSAMLRRIAANILQAQPSRYEVVAATRTLEGFAAACAGGVDLILLDQRLDHAAGMELCHRLQFEKRTENIPVILMIGHGTERPAPGSLPGNVVDTLVKPFAPEELSGLVNAIFGFTRVGTDLAELRASLHPADGRDWSRGRDDGAAVTPAAPWSHRALSGPISARSNTTKATPYDRVSSAHGSPFRGDTTTTSLRTLMHAVGDAGVTGVLRLSPDGSPRTEIFFEQGHLVVVSTRDGATYAERAVDVLPGKVSAATLDDAVAEQNATGVPFLLTLGTSGLLSKSAAVALLNQFGQRQFARLWPQRCRPPLQFEFEALDALPHYALRLGPSAVDLDEWLLATTRHLRNDDLSLLVRHEGTVGTPSFLPDGEAVLERLALTEGEHDFLGQVTSRNDLPKIATTLGLSQAAVYLLLFRFRCLEVLNYRPAPAVFVMTPRSRLRRVLPLER